jgi:hypothetical protein
MLQGRLIEVHANQTLRAKSQDTLEDLVEEIDNFSISDPNQTRKQFTQLESYSGTRASSESDLNTPDAGSNTLVRLQFGLRNSASVYEELILCRTHGTHELPSTLAFFLIPCHIGRSDAN